MERNYESGEESTVSFFVGTEVEKTPAFGMKTLFVVGVHAYDVIMKHFIENDCEHIFFGANHSFDPQTDQEWQDWDVMMFQFLSRETLCSLDIPLSLAETFCRSSEVMKYNSFIPQIRVPITDTQLWNYNTMVKIDDKTFDYSNPGVWCHSLHDLQDRTKFTPWQAYGLDKIIE